LIAEGSVANSRISSRQGTSRPSTSKVSEASRLASAVSLVAEPAEICSPASAPSRWPSARASAPGLAFACRAVSTASGRNSWGKRTRKASAS
jgi:hypothetical protein